MSRTLSSPTGYLALWRILVAQELAVRYRGTVLGAIWPLLMPVLMLAVYGFVFGSVFRARWPGLDEGDHLGFSLNLFIGLLVHGLLSEAVGQAPSLFQRHPNFVRKVVFPLPVLVAVPLGSSLVNMLLGLALVFAVNLIWGSGGYWQALAFAAIIAPYLMLLYGLALILAALGPYLRDLAQVVSVLVTVALFTGAVFYPRSMVPPMLAGVISINPISWPIEALRASMLHGQWPEPGALALYSLAAGLMLATGALVFKTLRPGFADVL